MIAQLPCYSSRVPVLFEYYVVIVIEHRSKKMPRHFLTASVLIALSVASCSIPDGAADEEAERSAAPEDKRTLPETSNMSNLQRLVEEAKADLVDRLAKQQSDPAEIKVLQADHVTWRSSAAGCPLPDRGYMMVLTPGVLIRLHADGAAYEYHSSLRGPPFLCEPPGKIETPAPGNSSLDPT